MSVHSGSEKDPQDETWDDWENDEMPSTCLFCTSTFPMPEEAFEHCKVAHHFDFKHIRRKLGLDLFQCFRMINYIRKKVQDQPHAFSEGCTFTGKESFLTDDLYLQPTLEGDALLYSFEEFESESDEDEANPEQVSIVKSCIAQATTDLEKKLASLLEASLKNTEHIESQLEDYKTHVKKTFYEDDDNHVPSDGDRSVYYFDGYAQNDIHEQMLKDRARTEAYRDFMYENKDIFKDKVVMDVGCGTGILSMFAAKAGAKKVFAIDNSNIIEKAKLNVKENGLDHIITLIRGKVEEIELPNETRQVDIIISEWMGYFLLFEAMLDSVLVARDKWMAPGGIMGPSHARIFLAALDDEDLKDDRVDFWNDVYGFKMSAMKEPILNEAIVDFFKHSTVISEVTTLKDLYLQTITAKQLDFNTEFTMKMKKDGTIHAFGGWFDTWFTRDGHEIPSERDAQSVEGETYLSTSPFSQDTHWKQTIFVLDTPINVKQGSILSGRFECQKGRKNPRELECTLTFSMDGSDTTHSQRFHLQA